MVIVTVLTRSTLATPTANDNTHTAVETEIELDIAAVAPSSLPPQTGDDVTNVPDDGSNVDKITLQSADSEIYVDVVHVPFVSTDAGGAAIEAYNI
ncbi:hypothetical protein EC957_008609 [Mortierella hygrophila]|uniref:Uncharacterized protein n=1 Tax=Mortierella hygrophila TaxID=979708 RepID=A0A9P6JY57_9FUNG|nr:hypothetical protein EC957_008609 [Mortierella hygrophila]